MSWWQRFQQPDEEKQLAIAAHKVQTQPFIKMKLLHAFYIIHTAWFPSFDCGYFFVIFLLSLVHIFCNKNQCKRAWPTNAFRLSTLTSFHQIACRWRSWQWRLNSLVAWMLSVIWKLINTLHMIEQHKSGILAILSVLFLSWLHMQMSGCNQTHFFHDAQEGLVTIHSSY